MSDTYKGDSPGKKIARYLFWCHTLAANKSYGRALRALVLPGREGGDIRTLRSLGFPATWVTGAESEASAFSKVVSLFPEADLHNVSVERLGTEPRYRSAFDVCLLDFCSPPSPKAMDAFCTAIGRSARHMSVVAVGFMYGREQAWRADLAALRDRVKGDILEDAEALDEARSVSSAETIASKEARIVHSVAYAGVYAARNFGLALSLIGIVTYHSRTQTAGGVPMMYLAYRVRRSVDRRLKAILREAKRAAPQHPWRFDVTQAPAELWQQLRGNAIWLARRESVNVAADAYNLKPATVAAWVAHDTRGTYAGTRTPEGERGDRV